MRVFEHPNLIITTKEMRKLLGAESLELTDEQVENLIITLTEIGSLQLNHQSELGV